MQRALQVATLLLLSALLESAWAGPNFLTTPNLYISGGDGVPVGQTFIAESTEVYGARWYIGDPLHPSVPALDALEGPADLMMFDATDWQAPILLAVSSV